MRLTTILGSPPVKGNLHTLAQRVFEGAIDSGIETEGVRLRNLSIQPRTGCQGCWEKGEPCVFHNAISPPYDTRAKGHPLTKKLLLNLDYLGLGFVDRIVVDDVRPKSTVLDKPDALGRAYQVGRSLRDNVDETGLTTRWTLV